MLVAVCDHSAGTSTSRCSKISAPLSFPIEAVLVSHCTSSYGVLPASNRAVKYRGNSTPVWTFAVCSVCTPTIFALACAMDPSWSLGSTSSTVPQDVVFRQGDYPYAVLYFTNRFHFSLYLWMNCVFSQAILREPECV